MLCLLIIYQIVDREDGRGATIGGLPLRYSLMNALL